MIKLCLSLVHS